MDCRFFHVADDLFRCGACGRSIRSPHPPERIHRQCSGERGVGSGENSQNTPPRVSPLPTLLSSLASYVLNHEAGIDSLAIEARLAVCRACDRFTGENCLAFWTCCTRARDFLWALVALEGHNRGCPLGKWHTKETEGLGIRN